MSPPLALAALAGGALGLGGTLVSERLLQEAGPAHWQRHQPDIPILLASLAGAPLAPGAGYPLDSHARLWAPRHGLGLAVEATVPPGGLLELKLHDEHSGTGVSLSISRIGDGFTGVATGGHEHGIRPAQKTTWLRCGGAVLSPVDQDRLSASLVLINPGEVKAQVGDQVIRCMLETIGTLEPDSVQPGVGAGLGRIALHSVETGSFPKTPAMGFRAPDPAWGRRVLAGLLLALLSVGGVWFGSRHQLRPAVLLAPLLPWLLTPLLACADITAFLQSARIHAAQPLVWCLGLPLVCSLVLAVALVSGRWVRGGGPPEASWLFLVLVGSAVGLLGPLALDVNGAWLMVPALGLATPLLGLSLAWLAPQARPRRGAVLGALGAGGCGLWALGMAPLWDQAALFAAGAGALFALVYWANLQAAQVRGFNLLSLGALGGGLLLGEHALAWTATGNSLVGRSSRSRQVAGAADDQTTTYSSFQALEIDRSFRRYPDQDYPVAPPARDTRLRLVAFGSSSTAGAYQNDHIDDFWPADVGRLLGDDVQVVNQGVGGWTSFHIRRYIETRAARIDPDLAMIYIGHNDVLTKSPVPYRTLFEQWRQGGHKGVRLSQALAGIRLYQALRFGIQALTLGQTGAAIPPGHAADNIGAIIDMLRNEGARILLVREGISPDPALLDGYGQMLQSWASAADVAYLDGAGVLSKPSFKPHFLDDCHLSRTGHETLAQAIVDTLRSEGWVDASP